MKCACSVLLKLPIAAALAISAIPAQAADMYAPGFGGKDGPVYEAVPNWTGFYLGVNGGYSWGAAPSTLTAEAADISGLSAAALSSKFWADGGFGGGQIGYNLQRDRFVAGIEADIQGAGTGGKTFVEVTSGHVTTDAWAKTSLGWFGTVRGRLGYAFGGTLAYATGGFAYGGVRDSLNQAVNITATDSVSHNSILTGYVAGGGVETALTPNWSVKAEYQYINLGSSTLATLNNAVPYTCQDACIGAGAAQANFDHTYHTVRLGLNYKVNQPYEPLK